MTDNMFHKIAHQAWSRFKDEKPKGKLFETRHFDFWVGAYGALHAAAHPEADHVGGCISMIISVRGWSEVARIAKDEGWE